MYAQLESVCQQRFEHVLQLALCNCFWLVRFPLNVIVVRVGPSWTANDPVLDQQAARVRKQVVCRVNQTAQGDTRQLASTECWDAAHKSGWMIGSVAATTSNGIASRVWILGFN